MIHLLSCRGKDDIRGATTSSALLAGNNKQEVLSNDAFQRRKSANGLAYQLFQNSKWEDRVIMRGFMATLRIR